MANISNLLNTIKNAVYGRDMRTALHDSIKLVNEDVESRLSLTGGELTGNITMNDHKITSSSEPSDDNDYVNKKYVDERDLETASYSNEKCTDVTNVKEALDEVFVELDDKERYMGKGYYYQFILGDRTFASINPTIQESTLTRYTVGANLPVVKTDTLIKALGKLQAQIESRLSLTGGELTGNITMNDHKITSSSEPSDDNDYVNKKYVDDKIKEYIDDKIDEINFINYSINDASGDELLDSEGGSIFGRMTLADVIMKLSSEITNEIS